MINHDVILILTQLYRRSSSVNHLYGEGYSNAQQQVEQWSTKASTEPYSGRSSPGHAGVSYQISNGVTPGQHCQTQDGITQTKHHSECSEQTDKLVSNDVDPDDRDNEPDECEYFVVDWRSGPGGEPNHDGDQERDDDGDVPDLDTCAWYPVIGHTDGEHTEDWTQEIVEDGEVLTPALSSSFWINHRYCESEDDLHRTLDDLINLGNDAHLRPVISVNRVERGEEEAEVGLDGGAVLRLRHQLYLRRISSHCRMS